MGLFRKQPKSLEDEVFHGLAKLLLAAEQGPEYHSQRELYDGMIDTMCKNGWMQTKCRTARVNLDWWRPIRYPARLYLEASPTCPD
jgi:hypothetical protein